MYRCRAMAGLFFVVMFSLVTSAAAGEKYFFCNGKKAYYCKPPVHYVPGCYVVRDNTNVVKVGSYPVISTHQAQQMCVDCGPAVISHANCQDCGLAPAHCSCLPKLVDSCHCHGKPIDTPISYEPGDLKVVCKKQSFYRAIGTIKGTIPVPQICVVADEQYHFRPKLLKYDCKDIDLANGENCEGVNCDLKHCPDGCCNVASCEVYNRRENCHVTCLLQNRTGPLVIAIRRATVGGQLVADVLIGGAGANAFQEYPRNLTVVKAKTQAEIQVILQNPSINFANIINGSSSTNLIAAL